jgi:hypothetical protein
MVQKKRSPEFKGGRGRWRFEHGDLVAQSEDLQSCLASRTEENAGCPQDSDE